MWIRGLYGAGILEGGGRAERGGRRTLLSKQGYQPPISGFRVHYLNHSAIFSFAGFNPGGMDASLLHLVKKPSKWRIEMAY